MNRIAMIVLLMAGVLGTAFAQVDVTKLITGNPASPEAITATQVGGKLIWIFYHAPSVRDPNTKAPRHIFNGAGALQPDGSVWRLGADYATVLHTDADLDLGGLAVPKGEYLLYVDLDKGAWKLILNKHLLDDRGGRGRWGINRDGSTTNDPAAELGRTALTMGKPTAPVETLRIALAKTGDNKGTLNIAFENVTASVSFTVK